MTQEAPRELAAAAQTAGPSSQAPLARNPWVSGAASLLLPGAGQALNGQFWKGTVLLLLYFLIFPVSALAFVQVGRVAGWLSVAVFHLPWLYSIVEAARAASRLNREARPYDRRRGAIYIMVLLLVVFPMVALVFLTVTLFLLPTETIDQIARRTEPISKWAEPLRRRMGLPK